jgi:ribulose-phosphate 3-epimerase
MDIVVPTILTPSRSDLEAKLQRVRGLARTVQIDVVDGRFAAPATWPYAEQDALKGLSGDSWLRSFGPFVYEVDLMVERPEESAGFWIAAGASRIIVHVESTRYLPELIEELRVKYGHEKGFVPDLLAFGLAINIDTDTRILEPHLFATDFVQFMGIRTIGKQGQPFDERVVSKLRSFHKEHPDIPIQVDGGVTLVSAPLLLSAGASRLVVGHDLWESPDISSEIAHLSALAEEYGQYR